MTTSYMLRCYSGHLVAHARVVPPMFADAYCKGCQTLVPIDSEENCSIVAAYYGAIAAEKEKSNAE